jgi:hypothetical protein
VLLLVLVQVLMLVIPVFTTIELLKNQNHVR